MKTITINPSQSLFDVVPPQDAIKVLRANALPFSHQNLPNSLVIPDEEQIVVQDTTTEPQRIQTSLQTLTNQPIILVTSTISLAEIKDAIQEEVSN